MLGLGIALLGDKVLQPINPKDEPMADNHLNAQQLQSIQNEASRALQVAIDRMQLRKWAVDQAFSRVGGSDDLIKIAREIYEFAIEPCHIKIEIE